MLRHRPSALSPQHWEWRYQTRFMALDSGTPSSELVRFVGEHRLPRGRAIDVGCGTGTNAIWLALQGFAVTGVDISATAIAAGERRAAAAGAAVRFVTGDLLHLAESEPFAFVFDRGCYHHLRQFDLHGYLRFLEAITQPGAWVLVIAGNANSPRSGPPVVTEEEIRGELGSVLQIAELREIQMDPSSHDPNRHLAWSCALRRN